MLTSDDTKIRMQDLNISAAIFFSLFA